MLRGWAGAGLLQSFLPASRRFSFLHPEVKKCCYTAPVWHAD